MKGLSLERADDRLVLRDLEDPRVLPLSVDFLAPALLHRIRHGLGKSQPLARALGIKGAARPFVIDATAGLGVDAFVMAAYGCRVRALERSPEVAALLADGFERLSRNDEFAELSMRLSFEHANSIEVLASLSDADRPDVIYLDPMYPEEGRSKSALPKKGMQMFRRLIGEDQDVDSLIAIAREKARDRVVIKRPLYAPPIAGVAHSFEGKTARFDLILAKSISLKGKFDGI